MASEKRKNDRKRKPAPRFPCPICRAALDLVPRKRTLHGQTIAGDAFCPNCGCWVIVPAKSLASTMFRGKS